MVRRPRTRRDCGCGVYLRDLSDLRGARGGAGEVGFGQSLSLAMSLGSALAVGDTSVTAKFTLTNNGSAAVDGCFGPSWGVSVIVGGHDAGHSFALNIRVALNGLRFCHARRLCGPRRFRSVICGRHGESNWLGEGRRSRQVRSALRLPRGVRSVSADDDAVGGR